MMESPRWKIITPSEYEWERTALDFVRARLPNHDPYRAWSNFEFISSDGAVYEVDLLVLTKQGFWLVEIKSWPGILTGDAGTWTRSWDGRRITEDNPYLLANRKAKALNSLIKSQQAAKKIRVPWLDALVFLSSDDIQCNLTGNGLNHVLLQDLEENDSQNERKGIIAALMNRMGPGISQDFRSNIDNKVSRALARAVEQAGIRPSQRSRRVGDYILGDLLVDGPGYQERLAKHATIDNIYRRVRQYTIAQADTEDDRQRRKRAAKREFQIIQLLDHPNILPVMDCNEHELGPALLFRYNDPNAVRFDHYLATNCYNLTTEQRIDILRQIADAIRHAHSKRVIHRSLGPQSILVTNAESDSPKFQIFNWQVGVHETGSTSARVTNVEDLVEAQSYVYMAPEAITDQRKITEASDVFSLGALAYHLFASRPPAGNRAELSKILRENKGLSLSAVVDGVGPKLEEFIRGSTHPDALTRIGTVEDFLEHLDDVQDELTAPEEQFATDPLTAKRGDRLEGGYVVERELGQGATAKALLVTLDNEQYVLKVALDDNSNTRLHEEAEALGSIHSEFIVAFHGAIEIEGRTVLVLQKAGDETLAGLLRREGVPSLDLLARYGDDLLSAVSSLERHGVAHRDIKPDNIGIRSLTKSRNQLILFDFSLAHAPLDSIRVGTPGYLDPFLPNRSKKQWDLAAERYSAGVTLYEMSMGIGCLPQWGEGIVEHRIAKLGRNDEQISKAQMAVRLVRWLFNSSNDETSFTGQACYYIRELSFVDWSREPLCRGETVPDLSSAYQLLDQAVSERRTEINTTFAKSLADWSAMGSKEAGVLGVEDVLGQSVSKIIEANNRVLLIVLDGMSWAVCNEILEDIRKDHWFEATLDEAGTPPPPIIATVPSITNYSRASLLSGCLATGDQALEKKNFQANQDLLSGCKKGHLPVLFHKKDITDGNRGSISEQLSDSILSNDTRIVGVVINAIDDRLSNAQQIIDNWSIGRISPLRDLLRLARDSGRVVILASDHGHVWHRSDAKHVAHDEGSRWRSNDGNIADGEISLEGSRVMTADNLIITPWSEQIYYGHQQNGYHGGASPQEMVCPYVILMDRNSDYSGLYRCEYPKPDWWTEAPVATPEIAEPKIVISVPETAPADTTMPPVLPGIELEEVAVEAVSETKSAVPATDWIPALLESQAYSDQRKLIRRHPVDNETMQVSLSALDASGGIMTPVAFAKATSVSTARLDGLSGSGNAVPIN